MSAQQNDWFLLGCTLLGGEKQHSARSHGTEFWRDTFLSGSGGGAHNTSNRDRKGCAPIANDAPFFALGPLFLIWGGDWAERNAYSTVSPFFWGPFQTAVFPSAAQPVQDFGGGGFSLNDCSRRRASLYRCRHRGGLGVRESRTNPTPRWDGRLGPPRCRRERRR